jgi:hypothetical protein
MFHHDRAAVPTSLDALAALDAGVVARGHGPAWHGAIADAVAHPVGRSDDRPGGHDDVLGVGAVAAVGDDDRHGGVAHVELGVGALADLVDDSGGVHARDVGRRVLLLALGPRAVADVGVGGVDRRRVHPQPDLAAARVGLGQLDDLEGVRSSVLGHSDGAHAAGLPRVAGTDASGQARRPCGTTESSRAPSAR